MKYSIPEFALSRSGCYRHNAQRGLENVSLKRIHLILVFLILLVMNTSRVVLLRSVDFARAIVLRKPVMRWKNYLAHETSQEKVALRQSRPMLTYLRSLPS